MFVKRQIAKNQKLNPGLAKKVIIIHFLIGGWLNYGVIPFFSGPVDNYPDTGQTTNDQKKKSIQQAYIIDSGCAGIHIQLKQYTKETQNYLHNDLFISGFS